MTSQCVLALGIRTRLLDRVALSHTCFMLLKASVFSHGDG
jgi:hypothetical protein